MDKNCFTAYNHLLLKLYGCHALSDLETGFLTALQELFRCSAALSFDGDPLLADGSISILQTGIVYEQKYLGSLILTRPENAPSFTEEDLFLLRSLTPHLSAAVYRVLSKSPANEQKNPDFLVQTYGLTAREAQILHLIFQYKNNLEIAETLSITESTTQKHIQNIFRKTGVSTKWDLLRFC